MIICHCNLITKKQIDAAIAELKEKGVEPTPALVIRHLKVRLVCGGCLGSYRKLTGKDDTL